MFAWLVFDMCLDNVSNNKNRKSYRNQIKSYENQIRSYENHVKSCDLGRYWARWALLGYLGPYGSLVPIGALWGPLRPLDPLSLTIHIWSPTEATFGIILKPHS